MSGQPAANSYRSCPEQLTSRITGVEARRPTVYPFSAAQPDHLDECSWRELPVGLPIQFAWSRKFRRRASRALFAVGHLSSAFRISALVLPTNFRLSLATSLLIAASSRLAADWFTRENLPSSRRGGLARVYLAPVPARCCA